MSTVTSFSRILLTDSRFIPGYLSGSRNGSFIARSLLDTEASLHPPTSLVIMTYLKVSMSVLLFQLFIHDIPLGDCALFGSVKNHKALYKALPEKLDVIQDWPRTEIVSFGIHKCWILPHTHRHSSRLTFFALAVQSTPSLLANSSHVSISAHQRPRPCRHLCSAFSAEADSKALPRSPPRCFPRMDRRLPPIPPPILGQTPRNTSNSDTGLLSTTLLDSLKFPPVDC